MPSSTVELTGARPIENETVSLGDVKMEPCGKHEAVSNGSLSCLGENVLVNGKMDSEANGHAQKNGESYSLTGSPTIKVNVNGTGTVTTLDLAPAEGFFTTKADGSVKIRIGDTAITSQTPMTVPQFFENTVATAKNKIALGIKRDGSWQTWTYEQYLNDVIKVAKSFIKLGLQPYHGVGIIGFNSPEWFLSDLGAIYAGGFAVGIYTTNSAEACFFVANDCNANIIVVENKSQLDKILKVWDRLPHLKAVVQYTGELEKKHENVYTWKEFMELGKEDSLQEELQSRINQLKPNKCCTLIYTSGTTGNPKGVMLSHDNLTWTAEVTCRHIKAGDREEHVVSYLPLSHIAAQMIDIYMPIYCKGTLWFAQPDALKGTLVTTLRECRPTLLFGVPRVWEKIQEKMLEIGRSVTGLKRKIANWAKGVALQGNRNIEKKQPLPFGWTLANGLVLKKIKAAIGLERCRVCFTGAAPITMDTLKYFQSINIPLYELYGMSECSGPHTVSIPGHLRSGSCGIVLDGMEIKILNPDDDRNGEICMKGRHVFMGYLNNEEKTEESVDDDGWLHSGDIGKVDQDGQVFITGRIKELIITAGGENIPPVVIEDTIKEELPLLSNVMVIGDKRKFLSCLLSIKVVMDPDTAEPTDNLMPVAVDFCKSVGCSATTMSEIHASKDEKLMKAIQKGLDRANARSTSRAQKVQKWTLLERDFSVPGGELGPTLKIRRPIVNKMYKEKIDAFYQDW